MKTIIQFAGILYFSVLFYIFFLARRRPEPTLSKHRMPVNFVPIRYKIEYLTTYRGLNGPERINFYTDLLGNMLVFFPFAFFLAAIFQVRESAKILFIAFITSVSVEVIQYILSIGVADIDDVILNMTGACAGVLFFKMAAKFARQK